MDERDQKVKVENGVTLYISSDDEEEQMKEGPRMDIEQINLVSDDEGEETPNSDKGKGRAKSIGVPAGGLKPIRIERKPHAERSVAVNTEASSAASAKLRQQDYGGAENGELSLSAGLQQENVKRKGKVRSKDLEFIKDERRWRGVWQTNDEGEEVIVKEEPEEAQDVTVMEVEPVAQEPVAGSSTENAEPQEPTNADSAIEEKEVPKPNTRRPRKAGHRDEKPVLQTEEDRQEWARHQQDIQLLVDELGLMPTAAKAVPTTTNLDPEGDVTMDDKPVLSSEVKDNRLFLFQLPPIVPGLVDMMLKEEPSEKDDQPAKADSSASTADREPGAGTHAKGSKSAYSIKADQKSKLKPVPLTADMSYVPKGLAGKLRVHESGRTTLSWGGSSLELSRAGDSEFLQDVVLVDVTRKVQSNTNSGGGLDGGDDGAEMQRRSGLGLGSVMGKYVVTPDWMGLL